MKLGSISVKEDTSGKSVAFFSTTPSVAVTHELIEDMIQWSRGHDDNDIRVCLHRSKNDVYQQMIILQHNTVYHRPHKEIKPESYHMICGKMMVCIFHPDGRLDKHYLLSADKVPVCRMGAHTWHMSVPVTPMVIFHEGKAGPYAMTEIQYPFWAPIEEKEGIMYTKQIIKSIQFDNTI
jgi:cupin fold WbuC family metalloprotein